MRRNLFFSLFLMLGFGLGLSSCAPGVYAGASVGGPGYGYARPYVGSYYGPRYYAPRPVIVNPRPVIVTPRPVIVSPAYRGGGYRYGGGERGWRGGGSYGGRGGYGGRRGGR